MVTTGKVSVVGDYVQARLVSSSGSRYPPGELPVGTYNLIVVFPSGNQVERADLVHVTTGGTVTVRCDSSIENCK